MGFILGFASQRTNLSTVLDFKVQPDISDNCLSKSDPHVTAPDGCFCPGELYREVTNWSTG